MAKDIFLICPVRGASEEEKQFLDSYVASLEKQGNTVHYPPRDTNQIDSTGGYQILNSNRKALLDAKEVRVYWNKSSQGSLFDIGVSFGEHVDKGKPVRLVNRGDVEKLVDEQNKKDIPKSFEKVLLLLDSRSSGSED
jgi:hypothetical protein